jgi:DNA-binding transcriptional regulator YiaG
VIAEKLRIQIGDNKNVFLTIEKAEEFNQRINFLSDEKSILEDEYFKMRSKYRSNQLIMDEAVAKSENYQELLDTLQRSKQSELSDRLIALSEKLQSMRLGEMRATRELKEVKEKNDYFARLLRTSTETVKNLEERVAEFESRMNKREEEFRRADNERMKRFFNARYDDFTPQRPQSAEPANPFSNSRV